MSWSFQIPKLATEGMTNLNNAISSAISKKILLFCTANDKGAQGGRYAPFHHPNNNFFRIGAATNSGGEWEWVGREPVDFIFPGHEILIDPQLSHLWKGNRLSGSSLATAFAAGFAALIMHIVKMTSTEKEPSEWDYSSMENAFRAVGVSGSNYIQVWNMFKTKEVDKRGVPLEGDEILERIAAKLRPQ